MTVLHASRILKLSWLWLYRVMCHAYVLFTNNNLIINLILLSVVLRYRGDVTMYCPEVAYSTTKWECSQTHWHALLWKAANRINYFHLHISRPNGKASKNWSKTNRKLGVERIRAKKTRSPCEKTNTPCNPRRSTCDAVGWCPMKIEGQTAEIQVADESGLPRRLPLGNCQCYSDAWLSMKPIMKGLGLQDSTINISMRCPLAAGRAKMWYKEDGH